MVWSETRSLCLTHAASGVADLTMNKLSQVLKEACSQLADDSLSSVLCSCLPSFQSDADWTLNLGRKGRKRGNMACKLSDWKSSIMIINLYSIAKTRKRIEKHRNESEKKQIKQAKNTCFKEQLHSVCALLLRGAPTLSFQHASDGAHCGATDGSRYHAAEIRLLEVHLWVSRQARAKGLTKNSRTFLWIFLGYVKRVTWVPPLFF